MGTLLIDNLFYLLQDEELECEYIYRETARYIRTRALSEPLVYFLSSTMRIHRRRAQEIPPRFDDWSR